MNLFKKILPVSILLFAGIGQAKADLLTWDIVFQIDYVSAEPTYPDHVPTVGDLIWGSISYDNARDNDSQAHQYNTDNAFINLPLLTNDSWLNPGYTSWIEQDESIIKMEAYGRSSDLIQREQLAFTFYDMSELSSQDTQLPANWDSAIHRMNLSYYRLVETPGSQWQDAQVQVTGKAVAVNFRSQSVSVPEPETIGILFLGLIGVALSKRTRNNG